MVELVSIIIPCYNVALYIERCLDSVMTQTYRNLEILCIDDGSQDKTGLLLDRIAQRDDRILVVHQRNQGLSAVRNMGKDMAKGRYLYYLDSDDYIESNTIEEMVKLLKETGADIVCSGFYLEYKNDRKIPNCRKRIKMELDAEKALGLYLYSGYVNPIAVAKLYRRELLQEIQYPVGKYFEDMSTTFRILMKAKKILYDSKPYYHYVQRGSSIGKIVDKRVNLQLEEAVDTYWDSIKNMNTVVKTAYAGRCFWYLIVYNRLICVKDRDKRLEDKIRRLIRPMEILRCPYMSGRKKGQLLLVRFFPVFYLQLYLCCYKYKKRRMSE